MSHEVIMPKLGLTMTHGKITRWLKKEGDLVNQGEPVAEIETDKINSEVEAPFGGYVLKILAQEGEDREITAPICIIGEKGETIAGPDAVSKPAAAAGTEEGAAAEVKISPLAKKIAIDNGIDYSTIKGTGPDGRIVKEDVLAAVDSRKAEKTADPEYTEYKDSKPETPDKTEEKRVPLDGVRKIIAVRLSQSKREIPHTYFRTAVDARKIIELKETVSGAILASTGAKLTLNGILIKAVASALAGFPDMNVSLVDDEIIYHAGINMGMAVDSPKGLIVPVIKNADKKSLSEIAAESGRLKEKAGSGKLTQEDTTGGTFTISNLGAYHIDEFTAVINPPESAILAAGEAREAPWVENGCVVVRPVMNLTLSVDHRVIDGALSARFMKRLKDMLETPYMFLV